MKIGDRTLFITHGHRHSVKSNLMVLSYRAKEVGADIACFGHSHQLGAEMVNGTLFINPGSIRLPTWKKRKNICDFRHFRKCLSIESVRHGSRRNKRVCSTVSDL